MDAMSRLIAAMLFATLAHASSTLPTLSFERNAGGFLARTTGYTVILTRHGAEVRFPRRHINLDIVGGNDEAAPVGQNVLPGRTNYLLGSNRSQWRRGIRAYGRVTYPEIYPGIDLVYYGNKGELESDFVLAPGAEPRSIHVRVKGTRRLILDNAGDLLAVLPGMTPIRFRKPSIYQEIDGGRTPIRGRYVLHDATSYGFVVSHYDRTKPLVIDPVLSYSTYLGGSGGSSGEGIAIDSQGYIYITGTVASNNFPTANALQPAFMGDNDVFVTKLDPTGSVMIYSTYLGSTGDDRGLAIAVDDSGAAYITGQTTSPDFPTLNPVQSAYAGGGPINGGDAFVAKLDPSGSVLLFSTYLGGAGDDVARSIAVGASGKIWVAGSTSSQDFPLAAATQPSFGGGARDGFIAGLDPDGSRLLFSSYVGGSAADDANAIAVDGKGNIYLAGTTLSTDFPVLNAFQAKLNGTASDGFAMKLNSDGIEYSTYLGGTGTDDATGLAIDAEENAYITGSTTSTNFPRANAAQNTYGGSPRDMFVSRLNPDGSALIYSTYIGGSREDRGQRIAVDGEGSAWITGFTQSTNFPTKDPVSEANGGGTCSNIPCADVIVVKMSAAGSILFASYLGGNAADFGRAIALDRFGRAYLTGNTNSKNFPVSNPLQKANGGGGSPVAFVAKIE